MTGYALMLQRTDCISRLSANERAPLGLMHGLQLPPRILDPTDMTYAYRVLSVQIFFLSLYLSLLHRSPTTIILPSFPPSLSYVHLPPCLSTKPPLNPNRPLLFQAPLHSNCLSDLLFQLLPCSPVLRQPFPLLSKHIHRSSLSRWLSAKAAAPSPTPM